MKKRMPVPDRMSRRDFSRSVAATIVSAPLISPHIKAKDQSKRAQSPIPIASDKDKIPGCDFITLRTEHIPPVSVLGGSFQFVMRHKPTRTPSGNPSRPHNYIVESADLPTGEEYGSIAWIWIISEGVIGNEGYFNSYVYSFSRSYRAQLRIWLQDVLNDEGSSLQPLGADPHIVIKGGSPIGMRQTISIETDMEFDRRPSNSPRRPWKLKHKGHAKEFRIGKWDILDGGGSPSGFSESDFDDYKFMITFHHP